MEFNKEEIEKKYCEKLTKASVRNLDNDYDEESGHYFCDEIIIELLKELDLNEVAKIYESEPKWYS